MNVYHMACVDGGLWPPSVSN